MDTKKKYILFSVILIVGIALDQVTKWIASAELLGEGRKEILGKLFSFTYAANEGAFLSLGATWPPAIRLIVLTILPGILLLGFLVYMLRSDKHGKTMSIAFALVAAGGIGNIIDRILNGFVVDFMHMDFGIFQTGVFNVADIYIMVGVGIFILIMIKERNKGKEEVEESAKIPASEGKVSLYDQVEIPIEYEEVLPDNRDTHPNG